MNAEHTRAYRKAWRGEIRRLRRTLNRDQDAHIESDWITSVEPKNAKAHRQEECEDRAWLLSRIKPRSGRYA